MKALGACRAFKMNAKVVVLVFGALLFCLCTASDNRPTNRSHVQTYYEVEFYYYTKCSSYWCGYTCYDYSNTSWFWWWWWYSNWTGCYYRNTCYNCYTDRASRSVQRQRCEDHWTGPNCNIHVDECLNGTSECSQLCTNTEGSFYCSCKIGYDLANNQRSCIDVDECLNGTSECSQLCTNTEGSFYCNCKIGYDFADNQKSCIDVDECLNGTSECSQLCANTDGSFYCSCKIGYELADNRMSCIDIDECENGESECSHCKNTEGSFICVCADGFHLAENGRSCVEILSLKSPLMYSLIGVGVAVFAAIILIILDAWKYKKGRDQKKGRRTKCVDNIYDLDFTYELEQNRAETKLPHYERESVDIETTVLTTFTPAE